MEYWQSKKCSLKKRGIPPKFPRIKEEQIREIIELYETGLYTYKDIAVKYNKTPTSIGRLLNKRGHKSKPQSDLQRKYPLDETFFDDIQTESQAYFLGFLCADGYIRNNKREIRIVISKCDIEILENFNIALKTTKPIMFYTLLKTGVEYAAISISSKRICEGLEKYGCVNAKTFKMVFPENLPYNLWYHFIRGYFDGDGSICISKTNHNRLFSIVGMLPFLERIQQILIDNCGLNKVKIHQTGNSCDRVKTLSYCGRNNCIKMREWMYKDATIFLKRKHERFLSV